jgi:dihydrofolate reductase
MQAPGGPEEDPSDTFTHGGCQAPFPDPAVGEFVDELNSHASAFLFGRRTFDIFRGYWPDQTDPANPITTAINSLPKYVASNSLSEADATWRGEHPDTARLVTGDVVAAVQALKDEPGDDLQIWGSGKLLQTLLQRELVDRFRLTTFPVVLGSGRRLFNDGTSRRPCAPSTSPSPISASSSAPTNQPVRFVTVRCDRRPNAMEGRRAGRAASASAALSPAASPGPSVVCSLTTTKIANHMPRRS